MTEPFRDAKVDIVVGMESRGFIFSAPMALDLGAGFVPVRKLGKLPAETISVEYELEYGTNTLEVHKDAIEPRPAGAHRRRPAGDRRHGPGHDRPGQAAQGARSSASPSSSSCCSSRGASDWSGYRIHSVIQY